MRVKLLTFRYSASLGGFDDTPLLELLRDKELVAFREHFFEVNDVPHVTCVVTWDDAIVRERPVSVATMTAGSRPGHGQTSHPAPELDATQRALFNSLREWRATTARAQGVPPFLVFTNRELAWIVTHRPESATALGHGPGIGPGKLRLYAEAVLQVLHGARTKESPSQPPPTDPAPPNDARSDPGSTLP